MDAPPPPAEKPAIAARLRTSKALIERLWAERLRQELANRAPPSQQALMDNIPNILERLATALACGHGRTTSSVEFESHAEDRIEWAYSAEDLIGEYVLLRKVVFSVLEAQAPIPPDDRDAIFEPFERAASTSSRTPGWGIGLTLTKAIVAAHGGAISVESTPSHGTTFTIRNPMDSRPFAQNA